ncbi:MAG TPA: ATP-binding protein [Gemmataceae bacterium]|jgi:hypothetical protein
MSAIATKNAQPTLTQEQIRQLSEIERQNYYTERLDDETYQYPLFSGKQAVLSQRRSGYRTSAKAAREIIDNAVEAGAKNVWIVFDRPESNGKSKKDDPRNKVAAIAFIDDGPGMTPKMARYSLTWGGGTHHEAPTKIGKFGFGLPNSSINQTKRVEVYTRTDPEESWTRAVLDITDLPEHGLISVPPAEESELPKFVKKYLADKKTALETGTVVVWVAPDRLTYTKASTLKEHFLDDFCTRYRYLLPRQETDSKSGRTKLLAKGDFKLIVEDVLVESVDPLFLTRVAAFTCRRTIRSPRTAGRDARLRRWCRSSSTWTRTPGPSGWSGSRMEKITPR